MQCRCGCRPRRPWTTSRCCLLGAYRPADRLPRGKGRGPRRRRRSARGRDPVAAARDPRGPPGRCRSKPQQPASCDLRMRRVRPIGEVAVTEVWTLPIGGRAVAGPVRPLGPVSRGAYPALRRAADAEARTDRPLLAVPLTHAPDHRFIAAIQSRAAELGADVMLMPLVGANRSSDLDASALVRAALSRAAPSRS